MLSKANRVSRAQFKAILESRRFAHTPLFTLRVGVSPDGRPRAAVSVSKKVSKKASTRNTVRRRAYAVLRGHLPRLAPALYLFVAKPGAERLKGEALERELVELLKRS